LALVITDLQQVALTISATDTVGNPAPLDGAPSWTSSDPTIATVTPDATNPLMASVASVGPLGVATVTVSADADMGTGVTTISATFDLEVVGSQAGALTIAAGVPEAKTGTPAVPTPPATNPDGSPIVP
jgi:hypothetical protein